MGFRMVKIFLTSGDLKKSNIKVKPQFDVEYLKNGTR